MPNVIRLSFLDLRQVFKGSAGLSYLERYASTTARDMPGLR
jgi:hypothetical protein